ncbi:TonB-dependent receptor [Emcibacter sp.]|uniref:TonB-dependent receptor n=1 Tax=Emcibacter sp. TaxID=1979954 RepID=UPI002AA73BBE|nr:TonB-dependent receptor [Emcibacter sp.]
MSPIFPQKTLRMSLMCGVAFAGMAITPAFSQESDESEAYAFEEIIVTSRKKQELLTEVPMNIAVVGSTEILKRNLINKEDFFRTVAGAASPQGELILRGLSGGNDSTPGTTSTYTDGIPFDFSDLYDVERVEVLRGPQGTLWGSNAIGGTVQVITNKPNLAETEVFGATMFSSEKNRDGIGVRGYAGFNLPLIDDKLALRVTGSAHSQQGKIYNTHTGTSGDENGHFIRAQVMYQASDDLNVNLTYVNMKNHDSTRAAADRSQPGYYYEAILTANPAADYGYDVELAFPECTGERTECRGGQLDGHNPKFSIWELMDPYEEEKTNLVSLAITKDDLIDGIDLTYVGSYREYRYDGRQSYWSRADSMDLFRTWIIDKDGEDRWTHELRLQNNTDSPLEWTVGAFYDKSKGLKTPDYQWQYHANDDKSRAIAAYLWGYWWGIGDPTQIGLDLYGDGTKNYNYNVIQYDQREFAAFGEASYTFDLGESGKIEITGGLRYFSLKDELITELSGIWVDPDGGIQRDETLGDDGTEDGFRKKFGVSYMPNEDLAIYAIYSEGYRPGGNNGPQPPADCFDDPAAANYVNRYNSDAIKNYEIGVKGNLLDRRLQFSAAAYQIDWSDVQTSVYMATCGFSYIGNTEGATAARSKGVEFESSARLTDSLTLFVNASYTDSKMLISNDVLGVEAGDNMTFVPKYNFYVALDQEFMIRDHEASVRLDVTGYGENKSHFDTRDEDISESYATVNLSGAIQLTDNARVSLYVDNILNKDYTTYKEQQYRSGGAAYYTYGDERTFTLRVDFKY